MRKDWKTLAEFTGTVAIVASMVFVGYEIRQNTSQLRTDGARSVTEMVTDPETGLPVHSFDIALA